MMKFRVGSSSGDVSVIATPSPGGNNTSSFLTAGARRSNWRGGERRHSTVVDETGRITQLSPAFEDTMVSITAEANRAIRHVRSRSVDLRPFSFVPPGQEEEENEHKDPSSRPTYSRFADISLAPEELFEGESLAGASSVSSIPTITGVKVGGDVGGGEEEEKKISSVGGGASKGTFLLDPLTLADMGLATPASFDEPPTSPFTLAAMRKRDRQAARYNLSRPSHLFFLVLVLSLGVRTLAGAPQAFYAHGRGSAILIYSFITTFVTLPLTQIQYSMGRSTRCGPYALFAGDGGASKGVGIAVVAYAALSLWHTGAPMAHSLGYAVASTGSNRLPWDPCTFHGRSSPECRFGEEAVLSHHRWGSNAQRLRQQQHCSKDQKGSCGGVDHQLNVESSAAFLYWMRDVLAEKEATPPMMIWICAVLSWSLVCACVVVSSKRGFLFLWSASILAVLFLVISLTAQFASPARKKIAVFSELFRINPGDLVSAEVWAAASRVALSNSALLAGPMIYLGSITKESGGFFHLEISLAVVTSVVLQTLLYASSLSVSTSALPGAAVGLDAFDFAFGALPGLFGDHRTVSLFFFAGLFLFESAACSVYVRCLCDSLLSSGLLLEKRLSLAAFCACAVPGFCGSLLLLSGAAGRTIHAAIVRYLAVPAAVAIVTCWLVMLIIYGPRNLGGSFTSFKFYDLHRWCVVGGLSCLLVLLPSLGLLSLFVSTEGSRLDPLPFWATFLGWNLSSFVVSNIFGYPAYRAARALWEGRTVVNELRVRLGGKEANGAPAFMDTPKRTARPPTRSHHHRTGGDGGGSFHRSVSPSSGGRRKMLLGIGGGRGSKASAAPASIEMTRLVSPPRRKSVADF